MKTATFVSRLAGLGIAAGLLGTMMACAGGGGSTNNGNNGNPPPAASAPQFLYAGTANGGVAAFTVDANTGALTPISGSPFMVGTGAIHLAADPSGKFLYTSSAALGGPDIQTLAINATSGALTASGSFTANITPGAIAVDPSGKNAYVVPDPSANSGSITAFSIDPSSHALLALPGQPTGVAGVPHFVVVDPSGKYVYITIQGTPGDEIAGRGRDPNTGDLTPLMGSPFGNVGGDNPQGIAVNPGGTFVVVANAATNNVSVMSLTSTTGLLNNVGSSPFAAGTMPVAVAITPSGQFVVVANQGSNNVSVYSMNTASGGLTPVSGSPFAAGSSPQAVAVDTAGKFVYVTNGDGTISGYTLTASSGALAPNAGSPFSVGTALRDVVVAK